jgi:hypothetical protein
VSLVLVAADKEQAGMPNSITKFKLSSIKDKRGMITNVMPVSVTALSWKVKDFPPPVGIKAKASLFDFVAFIISL